MQRYLATTKMTLRQQGYFGFIELLSGYILRFARLLAMVMIWKALFSQGADLDGMTLSQMLVYTVLSIALDPLLNVRTPASSWLHEGTILSQYTRPLGVLGQLCAHTVGTWILPLCLFAAPVLLIAPLFGVRLVPATGWFFLSLPLAVAQGFAVDFLFTCLLIRMQNIEWAAHSIRNSLTIVFSGSLIPFAVLPWGVGDFLALTPLGTLAGAPLSLFAGLAEPGPILLAQLFWNALLWPIAIFAFRRSREVMVSFGG